MLCTYFSKKFNILHTEYFLWRFTMKVLYYIALTLVIIGALNWLLIGLFSFDLVATLFGNMSVFSRIIYILVGISGIISLGLYATLSQEN